MGGWVEPNEHPAVTVVREAKEEIGLDIAVGALVGVFARPASSASGPHSAVSVVYRATVAGGELTPQPHEVLSARWWDVDQVPTWHLDHEPMARAALIVHARLVRYRHRPRQNPPARLSDPVPMSSPRFPRRNCVDVFASCATESAPVTQGGSPWTISTPAWRSSPAASTA